jgi:hypothetical protein
MVHDTYGITYLWDQDQFEEMITSWQDEWTGKALGTDIFVGPKKGETIPRTDLFVSVALDNLEANIGSTYNQMEELHKEYFSPKRK